MAATREQVMTALLAALGGQFTTVGRRNRNPETVASPGKPALILDDHRDLYERQAPSLPPRRIMDVMAIVYFDIGQDETAVPSTVLNNLLDGIDTAMAPDSLVTGRFTLGGLVYSCLIDGEIIKAPGDVTGKGLATVSIKIILP
ncbi:MAG: hypothetical protein ACREC9_13605 [Methylocella sp.]